MTKTNTALVDPLALSPDERAATFDDRYENALQQRRQTQAALAMQIRSETLRLVASGDDQLSDYGGTP